MTPLKPLPAGQQAVTPDLIVKDATKAIEFYKTAFGAEEVFRLTELRARSATPSFRFAARG